MKRDDRNKVVEKSREIIIRCTEEIIEQMCKSISDDINLSMMKIQRLNNRIMDYAEFQAKQVDRIEDELYELIKEKEEVQ